MKDGKPVAFLSRRFVPDDVVDAICNSLKPDIHCEPASDLILRPITEEILKRITIADLLIAIITKEGNSCWIQNELGMAYALKKPILVFYEQGVAIEGFPPMVAEYVRFDRESLAVTINDKERIVEGIQGVVTANRLKQQELTANEEQKKLGVIGVYPDRKDAFLEFKEPWNNENHKIRIVASTLEGFMKFVGDAGHALIQDKLKQNCHFKILLTDQKLLKLRANNEKVKDSSLIVELEQTKTQLAELDQDYPNLIEVSCFEAAPTCFAIITSDHILVNPYPYMRTAYSCFALIACKTMREDDIYHIYHNYHFKKPWKRANKINLTASVPPTKIQGKR